MESEYIVIMEDGIRLKIPGPKAFKSIRNENNRFFDVGKDDPDGVRRFYPVAKIKCVEKLPLPVMFVSQPEPVDYVEVTQEDLEAKAEKFDAMRTAIRATRRGPGRPPTKVIADIEEVTATAQE